MSEAVGPVRLNFCFPKHWCGCGRSADGGGRGKEGGEEGPLRSWSLSFHCLVLFALARLIESSFPSKPTEQVLKARAGALTQKGTHQDVCDCWSGPHEGLRPSPIWVGGAGCYRLTSSASTSPPAATPRGDTWGS